MKPQLSQESLNWVTLNARKIAQPSVSLAAEQIKPDWDYYLRSEQLLLNGTKESGQLPEGNAEFGLTLFVLNHLVLNETKTLFQQIGLPPSQITPALFEPDTMQTQFLGIPESKVGNDGTLYLDIPYGHFDPGWAVAGITNIFRSLKIISTHDFVNSPPILNPFPDQESLRIAIIGDWGTGPWKDGQYDAPSHLIGNAINNLKDKPDIVIHLGDVYYSGLQDEETKKLLSYFPVGKDNFNFTLNSNHEMYDGANGFFDIALSDPLFSRQNGSSFFALRFRNWILLALDSAYFDTSSLFMNGAIIGNNNQIQQDFIKSMNIQNNERVLIFTHHHGIDYSGKNINQTLFSQVNQSLGFYPDYWYYGHIHNGVVYNDKSVIGATDYQTRFNTYPRLRCVGHSAIPFGKADFSDNPGKDYFAQNPLPESDPKQKSRVLNGFAVVTILQDSILETMFEVCPIRGTLIGWQSA